MGLYDTIWQRVTCPNCNVVNKIGFQTKFGPRTLSNYRLGDKFEHRERNIRSDCPVMGNCPVCHCMINGFLWVDGKSVIKEIHITSYTVDVIPPMIIKKDDTIE